MTNVYVHDPYAAAVDHSAPGAPGALCALDTWTTPENPPLHCYAYAAPPPWQRPPVQLQCPAAQPPSPAAQPARDWQRSADATGRRRRPTPPAAAPRADAARRRQLARLFFGQLPAGMTGPDLQHIVFLITGCNVSDVDFITRGSPVPPRGNTAAAGPPTPPAWRGCAHAYCLADEVETIIAHLHRRVFVAPHTFYVKPDGDAFTDADILAVLQQLGLCAGVPRNALVVQPASSTYVPMVQQRSGRLKRAVAWSHQGQVKGARVPIAIGGRGV